MSPKTSTSTVCTSMSRPHAAARDAAVHSSPGLPGGTSGTAVAQVTDVRASTAAVKTKGAPLMAEHPKPKPLFNPFKAGPPETIVHKINEPETARGIKPVQEKPEHTPINSQAKDKFGFPQLGAAPGNPSGSPPPAHERAASSPGLSCGTPGTAVTRVVGAMGVSSGDVRALSLGLCPEPRHMPVSAWKRARSERVKLKPKKPSQSKSESKTVSPSHSPNYVAGIWSVVPRCKAIPIAQATPRLQSQVNVLTSVQYWSAVRAVRMPLPPAKTPQCVPVKSRPKAKSPNPGSTGLKDEHELDSILAEFDPVPKESSTTTSRVTSTPESIDITPAIYPTAMDSEFDESIDFGGETPPLSASSPSSASESMEVVAGHKARLQPNQLLSLYSATTLFP